MSQQTASSTYLVDKIDESSGHCDCCSTRSRCIWGTILRDDITVAAYWVRWTDGHLEENGDSVDLVVGRWGENAAADARTAISLIHRKQADGAWAFMVVDAHEARATRSGLAANGLRRAEVIGTPLATQVFALVDALYLQDDRLTDRG